MIDRFKCRFDNLIGKPFGYQYEIVNQDFHIKTGNETVETELRKHHSESKFIFFLFSENYCKNFS